MAFGILEKIAFSGVAAGAAAFAGLLGDFASAPPAAYDAAAARLEAESVATHASRVFARADLNKNGVLDADEYSILAIVSAELAQLNGFVAINIGQGVETVALPAGGLSEFSKDEIKVRAQREFAFAAGEDERLSADEFIDAVMEQFLASDADRNGVLVGGELRAFAAAHSRLPQTIS